ncbi:MAG TPA: ABC transporter ATP-binding protein [Bacteroidales bacterium]|nr:ABC transporter ATP-binding protein [Bacteroidales bacterium]
MINISKLSFGYKKRQPLFQNLNLELKSGSIYGLFGMNGAGKTTLLKHIAGLLFAQEGRCEILGKDVSQRLPEVLSNLFVIPEEFALPHIRISTFVDLNAPFYRMFDHGLFKNYLDEFEISNGKILTAYSYGQKKKFLIAFGLATKSKILLMDEPTNGLDIPSKSQFRRTLASVTAEDRCIVISTHQVRDLASIIDHITILDNGRIIFHHDILHISQKLAFVKIEDECADKALYAEDILGGKSAIIASQGHDTAIDPELLFNGVIKNHSAINNVLKN